MSFPKPTFEQNVLYIINGHEIDFSRCTIASNDSQRTIEPKVMAVLQYFVENHNIVISQQTLFEAVWPNQIFSQSLVQRAIAILRKALGDDPKYQLVFKTHPKKGYSFVAPCKTVSLANDKAGQHLSFNLLFIVVIAVIIMMTIWLTVYHKPVKKVFTAVEPISAKAQDSHSAKYSPNGKFLAYLQQQTLQKQHIWLMDLDSEQYYDLTPHGGKFSSISWSPKGDQLAYVSSKLSNGDFEMGVLSLNMVTKEVEKRQTKLIRVERSFVSPIAWSEENIWYFIEWKGNKSQVNAYDLNSGQVAQIMDAEWQHRHFLLALSPNQRHLALSTVSATERFEVGLHDLTSNTYQPLTKVMSQQLFISWDPSSQYLILNSENSNQYIDLKGNRSDIKLPEFMQIDELSLSPSGKAMVYTQNAVDSDILAIEQISQHIERVVDTNSIDISPRYSPVQDSLSFLSKRKGYMQVFITNSGEERLIYKNPEQKDILGPAIWSPDGGQIAIAQQDRFVFINVRTQDTKIITTSQQNMFIYDWYQKENALLVGFLTNDGVMAKKFDIDSQQLSPLVTNVSGGFKLNQHDELMFISEQKLSIGGQIVDLPLSPNERVSNTVVPVTNGVVLQSSTGNAHQLWLLDLNTKDRKTIMQLPEQVWRLEDITPNNDQYIFTSKMTSRKNIIQVH